MVTDASHISLHALTLDELTGVVNLYPWYAAARMELCRRMFSLGPDAWSEEEFASQALYVADRAQFSALLRSAAKGDFADADAKKLLTSLLDAPSENQAHAVRVVGGDYFSQAQYDKVKDGGGQTGGIFSRMALRNQPETPVSTGSAEPIAERFTTETLASIFLEQGQYEEARRIYSRLVLDIPEKSAYFASLIEKIDKII
ncbi:MAG: hypothetical protein IK008_00215 [Bacteroidales bacterium]|nr:hypothetical protein [Bacteroidales bacterium]